MAGLNATKIGTTSSLSIALFGPQATRWSDESLRNLQTTLRRHSKLAFVIDVVEDFTTVVATLEKIGSTAGIRYVREHVKHLVAFVRGTSIPDSQALSNSHLATLTVIDQIIELYEKSEGFERLSNFHVAQGFCIGLLSATALSLSSNRQDFEKFISTALRLALCTGFVIDDGNISSDSSARTTAISVRWKTASERSLLDTFLDASPNVYVSCVTDEQALTVTLPETEESSWRVRLREVGIVSSLIGLNGSYHSIRNHAAAEQLKKLCAGDRLLEFPDATALRLPLRSTADASLITEGRLHDVAIDLILLKKCHWYTTIRATQDSLDEEHYDIVSVGKGSFMPRSLKLPSSNSGQRDGVEEIAVIGMACRFPKADSVEQFWDIIESGSTSIGRLPSERFSPSQISRGPNLETYWGNFLERPDTFDHRFFGISGREAKSMDPQQRLALQVAYEALESSGLCGTSLSSQETDVGCYLGVGSVDYNDNVGSEDASAFAATGTLRAFISGRLSHYFGWLGPSITFDTACSSSAVAIHTACRALLGGECSMALAGGVNVITSPDLHQNLSAASFLNANGSSKAFDQSAGGYCRGEGAGLLVLKPLSKALTDSDNILGVISGSAINQGSNCSSITVPDSESQSVLYKRALSQGKLDPLEVSFVEAHGTGTQVGDPIEYASVQKALTGNTRKETVFLGSVKDNIGHCEAASGAAGLIKTLLMLQNNSIPKQANFNTLNPKIRTSPEDKIVIPKNIQPWTSKKRIALINNYGAAGSNAAIAVREYTSKGTATPVTQLASYPFVISAKSFQSLQAYAGEIVKYIKRADPCLRDLSYNLCRKQNPSFDYKYAFTASGFEELDGKLQAVVEKDKSPSKRPVVLAFGGQTGRTVVVSQELYRSSSILRRHLDQCNNTCIGLGLPSIFPVIFNPEPTEEIVELHCQLLALQIASAKTWMDLGVVVDTVVGHSFGQISALCVAGALSLTDAFRFVSGRARLIGDAWGPVNGTMLSIDCNEDYLATLVEQINSTDNLQLSVACYNGLRSFVLAGDEASIAKAEEAAHQCKTTRLNNSHAYHSHFADNILDGLAELAKQIRLQEPRIPVETCSDNQAWQTFDSSRLAEHTREPVYFGAAVERIADRLPSAIWLEAGSASPILALSRRVLKSRNRDDDFVPIEIGATNAIKNLASAATQLWQAGVGAQFWPFDFKSESSCLNLTLPPYQFEDTRHWIQYKPRGGATNAPRASEPAEVRGRQLVTLIKHNQDGEALFSVDTADAAFELIVRGHAVTGHSLCPASMYVELVIAGAMQIRADLTSRVVPHISGLAMTNPLGLRAKSSVFIRLQSTKQKDVWEFSLFSRTLDDNAAQRNAVNHANGRISLVFEKDSLAESKLQLLKRVVKYSSVDRITSSLSATGISGDMVYQIFSSVVAYEGYFQGVKKISALGNEAVGLVVAPSERPYTTRSLASDPILVDNFLQVAGIHVNCLSPRSEAEVFVCTAIEEITYTQEFTTDRSDSRSWTVYTRFDYEAKGNVSNQIFVYDTSSQELVLTIVGAVFKSVPFKSLSRTLSNVNGSRVVLENTRAGSIVRSVSPETWIGSSPSDVSATSTPASELSNTPVQKEMSSLNEHTDNVTLKVREMFSAVIEIPLDEIKTDSTLNELGIDSLLVTEVLTEIKTRFQVDIDQAQMMDCTDLSDVCKLIQPQSSAAHHHEPQISQSPGQRVASGHPESITKGAGPSLRDVFNPATLAFKSFEDSKSSYDTHADTTKFSGFCSQVHPLQSELVIKYVANAFVVLGVDLAKLTRGDAIPPIPFQPQHTKVASQLYLILQDAGLIEKAEIGYVRTLLAVPDRPAEDLHSEMLARFPQHSSETKLLHTTAPKLAECLMGKADPISLIFKDASARKLLEDVYTNAPMFKTGTLLLIDYLASVVKAADGKGVVRILELGGGTGGTTSQLVEMLASLSGTQEITYTFTDLSSSLVAAARRKFAKHGFMEYTTMDIEKDPAPQLLQKYDIVISTNCIHATKNLIQSTTNIRKMLRPTGILCLIELTRNLYWFDLVFGLLEGWWLFNDGREHALAHEHLWDSNLKQAGFQWVDWSNTTSKESDILRVITASPSEVRHSPRGLALGSDIVSSRHPTDRSLTLKDTLTFKVIDGLDLEADIYYPPGDQSERILPVALMIHGGGHIMLSRNDVRPEQTQMLIERGFLPISIDYRLCPEVTLQDGPMSDVVDALAWIRTALPNIKLSRQDLRPDGNRVVAVGWSTGGTLAMSLAWQSRFKGIAPPDAIFTLYCPSDYNDEFWQLPNVPAGSKTKTGSLIELDDATWVGISNRPIKAYNIEPDKNAVGGWLATSDARSRIALYMNHQGRTLTTLVKGLHKDRRNDPSYSEPPTEAEINAISPLAQVQSGQYRTPTFAIHPRNDDLIPLEQAERLAEALETRKVPTRLEILEDVPHLFDVHRNWRRNQAAELAVKDGYDFLLHHVMFGGQ